MRKGLTFPRSVTNRRLHIRKLEHIRGQIDHRQRKIAYPRSPLSRHRGVKYRRLEVDKLPRAKRTA